MNIAIFTDTYLPDINGVVTSTHILHDELKRHGHHVLVVTTILPTGSDYEDEDQVIRIPGLDLKKLYGYRAANIYSFKGMKEIKDFAPDVIHIQTEFGVGIFGKIVGEVLDVPVCYTYHTMWADYSHYVSGSIKAIDSATKKVIVKMSKIYGDTCAQLIVPSEKTAEALKSYGIKNNINVVATGLELDKFSREAMDAKMVEQIKNQYDLKNHFVVIFLGRIAPEKSIDLLIEALNDVRKTDTDVKMLIVGGGPQLDELKDKVKNEGAQDYVVFTGPQESSLVPQFYHAADLFVSGSLTETQGLTYIEAMASGLPILARHDKNLEEVIKDGYNGYFFKDKEDLVKRIISLKHQDLSELSNNALEDAKSFGSEVFYEKILHVYNKALRNHHYCYRIEGIAKEPKGYQVTCSFDNHQVIINATKDTLERYGLIEGQVIDREELDALKDLEQVAIAYKKALKYLSYKDYSYEKMKRKLLMKGAFDEMQIEMTMDLLVSKNLIDDYEYTKSMIRRYMRMGYGLKYAALQLKKDGVSPYTIDECLSEFSGDLEFDKAVDIVKKLYNANTTKSPNALINNIKNKLFNKGFSEDVVNKAMNSVSLDFPKEHTRQLLEKEYQRVYNRYKNKYEGKMLKSKLITFLVQKGYEYEDVVCLMEDVWRDENED